MLKQLRLYFGETQKEGHEVQEAVTSKQTGNHSGNYNISVWNYQATTSGPGVCEGGRGGGHQGRKGAPVSGGTPDLTALWLFLCWEVSVCMLGKSKGKDILFTIF